MCFRLRARSCSNDKYFYRRAGGLFATTKPINRNEANQANGGTFYEGDPGYQEGFADTTYIAWLRDRPS